MSGFGPKAISDSDKESVEEAYGRTAQHRAAG